MKIYLINFISGLFAGLLFFFVVSIVFNQNPLFLHWLYYFVLIPIFFIYKFFIRNSTALAFKEIITSLIIFGTGFIFPVVVWYLIVRSAFQNAVFGL